MDNDQIRREASHWAMRQRMERLDEASLQQLAGWLSLDPSHAVALADAEMAWELGEGLRHSGLFNEPVPKARRNRLASWLAALRLPRLEPGWRWSAAALVVVLSVAGVGSQQAPVWMADYRSVAGEVRQLQLEDGSQVLLAPRAALSVRYNGDQRLVRLVRGEALFTPAPLTDEEPRPFVVDSGGAQAQALGTRFVVRRDDAQSGLVAVLEHEVRVSLSGKASMASAQLDLPEGRSARYSLEGGVQPVDLSPVQASDWTRGVLIFQGEPLEQVLQRLGDFRPGVLHITNREAAQRPVRGLFHLDNLDDGLSILAHEFELRTLELPGMTLLY